MPGPAGFKEIARVHLSDDDASYLQVFRDAANRAQSDLDIASMVVAARYGGDVSDHTRCSYVDQDEVVLCELLEERLSNQDYREGMVQGGRRNGIR